MLRPDLASIHPNPGDPKKREPRSPWGRRAATLLGLCGLLFVAGCSEDSPSVIEPEEPEGQVPFETIDGEVTAISPSPGDVDVLYSTSTKEIWSIDVTTGEERMLRPGQIFASSQGFDFLAITPLETEGADPDYLVIDRDGNPVGPLPREMEGAPLRLFLRKRAVYGDSRMAIVFDRESDSIVQRFDSEPNTWLSPFSFSPDEKSLAYSVYEQDLQGGHHHQIRIMDLDSGVATPIWDGPGSRIHWSPKGTHLGFSSSNGNSWQIYLYELGSGREPVQVSDAEHTTQFAWSPDGSRLVCKDLSRFLAYDLAGSEIAAVDHHDVRFLEPFTFGPDGQTILHGRFGIEQIDLSTGEAHTLAEPKRLALYPRYAEVAQLGIRFEFETDQTQYGPGEATAMTFRLRNEGELPVRFDFPNIQQLGVTATAGDLRRDYPGIFNPALSDFLLAVGEIRQYRVEWNFRDPDYGGFGPGAVQLEGYLLDGMSPRLERVIELTP